MGTATAVSSAEKREIRASSVLTICFQQSQESHSNVQMAYDGRRAHLINAKLAHQRKELLKKRGQDGCQHLRAVIREHSLNTRTQNAKCEHSGYKRARTSWHASFCSTKRNAPPATNLTGNSGSSIHCKCKYSYRSRSHHGERAVAETTTATSDLRSQHAGENAQTCYPSNSTTTRQHCISKLRAPLINH